MYIVIFRACIHQLDADYSQTAQRMREKAFAEYGCVDFVAVSEGDQEIALSYWNSLEDIRRWQQDAEHRQAQQKGRERWYREYSVEIAPIERGYRNPVDLHLKLTRLLRRILTRLYWPIMA